jgi:uncharacterized protein YpmS
MKWLKRLFLLVAILLLGVIVLAAVGYHYLRQTPDFYRSYAWSAEQRSIINQQAVNKLLQARNIVADAHFAELRSANARKHGTTLPQLPTVQPMTVSFTEEELNAFLSQNSETVAGFKEKLDQYLIRPGIFLKDRQIILAGEVKDLHSIVSCHFLPILDCDGMLHLALVKTSGGRLPLPRVVLSNQLDRIASVLQSRLPAWQRTAKMDPSGGSNASTVAAAMSKLFLGALADQPTDAVLFMPVDEKGTSVPLRLTQVKIEGNCLTLTVEPMSSQQRSALFARILQPFAPQSGNAPGLSPSSP